MMAAFLSILSNVNMVWTDPGIPSGEGKNVGCDGDPNGNRMGPLRELKGYYKKNIYPIYF
jgi:hypothetical protein